VIRLWQPVQLISGKKVFVVLERGKVERETRFGQFTQLIDPEPKAHFFKSNEYNMIEEQFSSIYHPKYKEKRNQSNPIFLQQFRKNQKLNVDALEVILRLLITPPENLGAQKELMEFPKTFQIGDVGYRWVTPLKYDAKRSIVCRAAEIARQTNDVRKSKRNGKRSSLKSDGREVKVTNVILKIGEKVENEANVIGYLKKNIAGFPLDCKACFKAQNRFQGKDNWDVMVLSPVGKSFWDLKTELKTTFNLFVDIFEDLRKAH